MHWNKSKQLLVSKSDNEAYCDPSFFSTLYLKTLCLFHTSVSKFLHNQHPDSPRVKELRYQIPKLKAWREKKYKILNSPKENDRAFEDSVLKRERSDPSRKGHTSWPLVRRSESIRKNEVNLWKETYLTVLPSCKKWFL